MNAELLLAHFDRISDAPDAVPRLRRFLLDLAVRGKLVEQNPRDEAAVRRPRSCVNDNPQNERAIPLGWFCGTIGDFLEFQYGKGLPASEREARGPVPVFGSNGVVGYCSQVLTDKPSLVVGRKGSAGAINICDGPSWTTDVAYFVEPPVFFDIRYLYFALRTLDLDKLGKGVKPGLSRSDAYQLSLLVPPLAEQHRIVAKVDELMALCDRLEAAQRERESRRGLLAASTHHHLNDGADAETLRSHAQFFIHNLPRITTRPDQVKQLRQTILNLAVRGKLVHQNPSEVPARSLLKHFASEIREYSRAQRIAIVEPDPVAVECIPYSAPSGWEWTRLSKVFKVIADGDHQSPPKEEDGVAFLTIGNITNGYLDFSNCRYVSRAYFDSVAAYRKPANGDLLYTVVGATFGRAVLVDSERPFCVQRHIAILKPTNAGNTKFLHLLLSSPFVYEQAARSTTGTAQPTIPLRPLRNFVIPLPPLAEQHRIVARVEELMALCDQLESQLTSAQTEAAGLLESLLHNALNPQAAAV